MSDQERAEHEHHHLEPAEKEQLLERLRDGVPIAELAREYDVPHRVVRQWARHERKRVAARTNGGDPHPVSAESEELDAPWPPPVRAPIVGWVREEIQSEPYVSPGRSVRARWRLVAACGALGLALGLVVGLVRGPSYSAEARLVVGKTVQLSNLAATPGLALASQQLASDYSRLVSTHGVLDDTAHRLGRPSGDLGGSVSASPIPQSPVILIEAHAGNAQDARAIADAGASALVHEVNALNEKQLVSAQQLLDQYRKADEVLLRDQQTLKTLQDNVTKAGASATQALKDQVVAAQTAVDADQLNLNAMASDYEGAITPGQLNEQVVQRVGAATATGNDRVEFFELAALIGAVVGLLVGAAIAVAIDVRAQRKRDLGDVVVPG